MIELHCNFHFENEEKKNLFLKGISENMIEADSCAEEGNCKFQFTLPVSDSLSVLLIEQWKDQDALDLHKTLPHFLKFTEIKNATFSGVDVERFTSEKL